MASKQDKNSTTIELVQSLFKNRNILHVFLWGLMIILVILFDDSGVYGFGTVINTVTLILFYWFLVYINFIYLFPKFLDKKKFVHYLFYLTLACLILSPLRSLLSQLIGSYYGEAGNPTMIQGIGSVFITLMLVGSISAIVKIFGDWLTYARVRSELEKQNMQSELNFLKSQVNPHFLFNTLNSLYALTLKKSDAAPEIVIKLSEMMRYMLYECNEKFVPLHKEINYLKNYMDLERLRHGEAYNINFKLNGAANELHIAPLLFISFIENAFKHGLSNNLNAGFVDVELNIEEKEIELLVKNSKPNSLPSPEKKISGGIGLVNVRRRLDLIYPNAHTLKVMDNPNDYCVLLNVKLK